MLTYKDAGLEDREDFSGMNDFEVFQPPLVAHLMIDGMDGLVTVARDDNDHFRIEIFGEDWQVSLTGEPAAFAMVTLQSEMTIDAIRTIFGDPHPRTI
jgi:hypothetical protein